MQVTFAFNIGAPVLHTFLGVAGNISSMSVASDGSLWYWVSWLDADGKVQQEQFSGSCLRLQEGRTKTLGA